MLTAAGGLLLAQAAAAAMSPWDWAVVAVYLAFMIAVGVLCRRLNSGPSDYFRGGGQMLWWMSGSSMIISSVSLWTFSAAGVRVYETGFYQVLAYFAALAGIPLLYLFFAQRFRRMRVITSADAIRRRYGATSEQVWVWITVPINIFYSALGLHTIAVFVAAATGFSLDANVIALGAVITFMSLLGGAWAVSASDFLQGVLTVVLVVVVLVKTMAMAEVGGVAGFIDKMPPEFVHFNLWSRPVIWVPWLLTQAISGVFRVANLDDAGSYFLKVKDDRHARKQVLLYTLMPLLPLMVFLPIMASRYAVPELSEMFPNLSRPAEAAYVGIAMKVLPVGMIGMLVCAIFAVQMSSLDTGLNKSAGFVVCNFYRDILRPQASERELLWAGMVLTGVFGVVLVAIALAINANRTLDLFQYTLLLAPLLQLPLMVPMALGTFIRRTPGWSAWSSALVGLVTGSCINLVWLRGEHAHARTEQLAGWLGMSAPLNEIEAGDLRFIVAFVAVVGLAVGWYLLTTLFWKSTPADYRERVDAFFDDMTTPLGERPGEDDPRSGVATDRDRAQYRLLGGLTLAASAAIALGAVVIPNGLTDRATFLACAAAVGLVGGVLFRKR